MSIALVVVAVFDYWNRKNRRETLVARKPRNRYVRRYRRLHDNYSEQELTRAESVGEIERGNYPNYHVRDVNGFKTPVSNPDGKEGNNLG